jgi:nicotinate dehydrogenase subunit B
MNIPTTRRNIVAGGGLMVAFALSPRGFAQEGGVKIADTGRRGSAVVAPDLPGDLSRYPLLDSWIRVDHTGAVTVFTGKVEFGQGIKTALVQLAAEELDVAPSRITVVTADTARTVDEGVTSGSHSMQDSGTAVANAAANVRKLLVAAAAAHWAIPPEQIVTRDGSAWDRGGRGLTYGALAAGLSLHVAAEANVPRKTPADFRLIGTDFPRIDIPAKLTGGAAFVHDLRLPRMLHGRVLLGPSDGAQPKAVDVAAVETSPGIFKVVRNGRFVAILAEREWEAINALRALQAAGWERPGPPIPAADLHAALKALPSEPNEIFNYPGPPSPADARTFKASYSRPYLLHGSIGPSCAVALWDDAGLTVWTHSQGVGPLKKSLAELFSLKPEQVRCIHMEGAGCYGQNGADDVAADAALAARAVPGRPVRMQWMREQEHGWEPMGPAMSVELTGALGPDGRITAWHHELWSNEHSARPNSAGGLRAGAEVDPPFPAQKPKVNPMPEGGAMRNGNPLYALPNADGLYHFIPEAPVRVSALRSLGAHMNIFAIESFMTELALAAHVDPVAFRLSHLRDPRASAVIARATERFNWAGRPKGGGGRGCGFAFARYKNLGAYCAVAMEVEVGHETGVIAVRRIVAAVDSGEAVNPDGIRNQIEGSIVQSLSWTTQEEMTFDTQRRTGFDWSAYPILRFPDAPERVEVNIINRPGTPFLGTGEAAQGPTAAAVANAVFDAVGIRMRDMPLSPARLKAAIGI